MLPMEHNPLCTPEKPSDNHLLALATPDTSYNAKDVTCAELSSTLAESNPANPPCTASSNSLAKRASIIFGFSTALQIARTLGEAKPTKNRRHVPPPAAPPRQAEATDALEALLSHEGKADLQHLSFPIHCLVARTASRRQSNAVSPHSRTSPIPPHCLHRIGANVYCAIPAFALLQEATRITHRIALLELCWEACGTYRTARTSAHPDTAKETTYGQPPLTSVRSIRSFVAANPSLHGSRAIAAALRYLADGSASPRETKCALLFGLPMSHGGYALGIPRMNYRIRASMAAQTVTGKQFFRGDMVWPDAKLILEYQSFEDHANEASRLKDSRRENALQSMGWTVVAITNDELDSMASTDVVAETLRKKLGAHKRPAVPHYHARKLKLRRLLGLRIGHESESPS